MTLLFVHFRAGASGNLILASLPDLGADPQTVRQAVESVGCRLETSRQDKRSIKAGLAIVTSEKRSHLGEAGVKSQGLQHDR